jgi:hypothetical protein
MLLYIRVYEIKYQHQSYVLNCNIKINRIQSIKLDQKGQNVLSNVRSLSVRMFDAFVQFMQYINGSYFPNKL